MKINKTFINKLNNDPMGILRSLNVDDIVSIIQKANHDYYNKGTPLFTDQLFDVIKEYLAELEPNHPVLKNIGANIDKANKVKLPFYMGSLDKIKNDEKVLMNWKNKFQGDYVLSDKLDGNSGLLTYVDGELSLYSRGDGVEGQNITHLLPFFKNKVNIDAFKKAGSNIAVRGEVIMSKQDFATVADNNANARNTVAGLINAKIPDLQIASLTSFVVYEVVFPLMTPVEQMKFIKSTLKLDCVYNVQITNKQFSLERLSDELTSRRSKSPDEIDGIVVSHNAIYKRVDENPDHSFAFKSVLTMEKAEVTVTKVEWNMSKDGLFIPVVEFTPVSLDGVTITRAHGFNGKYINDNVIGPGATIVIMRSGAVIPYIVETLVKASKPQMPDTNFVWSKSGVDILLNKAESSKEETEELQLRNVEYFFETIDVRGLSSGIIARIFNKGFKTVGEVLNITKTQLLTVEGFKEALATKIFTALQARKSALDAYTIMSATNVLGRGIGQRKIKLICDAYPTIVTARYLPTVQELVSLKGVEAKTAELFIDNLPALFKFLDDNGLTLTKTQDVHVNTDDVSPTAAQRVTGKSFVFSGVRDKEVEMFIEANGGSNGSSVSSKTALVIVKDFESDSGKVTKAKALGIPIMLLSDFRTELGMV